MVLLPQKPHTISSYPTFPSLDLWKSDSKVGNRYGPPSRKSDRVLDRIDNLVGAVNKAQSPGQAQYLMGEIYFATIFWNNNHSRDPSMHADRRTAIMRLQLTSANMLALALGCGVGGLASALERYYGKSMSPQGVVKDTGREADYLDRARAEAFRVVFKGGTGWRFGCLENTQKPNLKEPLKPLDTKDYAIFRENRGQSVDIRIGDDPKAGYVMSMGREFYVGPFMERQRQNESFPKFHSYFMGGRAIQCAGMIAFKDGKVRYIDNESGHYKPIDLALVKAVEQLKTVGMDLSKVTVASTIERDRPWTSDEWSKYKEKSKLSTVAKAKLLKAQERTNASCDGNEFLAANGNWDSIVAGGNL